MQHYRKVSFETRSRISSEISPKVARITAHSASDTTSNEVLKTSRSARAARVNAPQGTRRANAPDTIKVMEKINPAITLLFELCNFRLSRVLNNSYGLIGCWTSMKVSCSSTTNRRFCRGNQFCRFRTQGLYPHSSQATQGPHPTRDPRSTYAKTWDLHSVSFRTWFPHFWS